MRKLFKFLTPYGGAMLAILCVLIVQAYCDLSLPTYTSDIVNTGIQQKGIDEKVPYEISEEDFEHLLLFVPAKEQETVKNAYQESQGVYEYDGAVMEIKEAVRNDGEKLEELSEILGKPMLLCAGFDSGNESAAEIEERMKEQLEEQLRDQLDVYDMFGMMEDAQREAVISEIGTQFSGMPETMAEQSAAVYIENVYKNLGIDIDRKEIHYILKTGGKMLALAALGMLASILVGLLASRVGAHVGRGLRKDVFRKVVGFSNGE